jgi:UDP-glucose 4-epimerase
MIIILGASGFIGTYLADELCRQNRPFIACGRNSRARDYFQTRNVSWADLDISRAADFARLPTSGVDAVVLLSALLPANDAVYSEQRYIDINLTGTLNALAYAKSCGAKKFINTTSHSDVAGLWECGRPIREEDARSINLTGDHAVYIITKLAGLDLVEHYRLEYGLQTMSFRLPAVYGYGPHTEIFINGKRHVTGFKKFINRAQAGQPLEVWGDWKKGRDLVYVKDVVGAYLGAFDSTTAAGLYNIASGVRTTLEEEAKGIAAVFSPAGKPVPVINIPEKPNGVHTYLYDINKARRDLGYAIRFPYLAMLEDYKSEMRLERFPHLIKREDKAAVR